MKSIGPKLFERERSRRLGYTFRQKKVYFFPSAFPGSGRAVVGVCWGHGGQNMGWIFSWPYVSRGRHCRSLIGQKWVQNAREFPYFRGNSLISPTSSWTRGLKFDMVDLKLFRTMGFQGEVNRSKTLRMPDIRVNVTTHSAVRLF